MLVKNLQQLSRTPTTSDLVGQAELRLVIRSGQHRGQRVRLMAAQSSIGSGLGCTLRAAMPGVAPLHCWLHNSGRMTSLQANGFEVIHNGRAVSHAIIQPGDTLRLGTLDLQVAECPHETIPLSPAPELSFGAGAALDAMETLVAMEASNQADDVQTSNPTARTARDLQALRNERRIGHRRLKRALLQLREVQSRFQSLARREQDLLVANRSLSAFHTTEREELLARIAEHHQEGLNLSQQLASAEAKLRSERAESAKLLQTAQATAEELSQAQTTVAHLSQEASSKHEALQLASLDAEKAHADHEAYVKSAEKALNSIKQELARHLDEKVHLQSELIEREAHARSLEEQVIILQQQLTQQQMSAVEMPHAKHAGIDDLEIQLESERRKHEQEAAEFTAVRARLERELTCLAATVREFQAERIAMFDASSAGTEEEKEAQEFAQQELATMLHKRQAEQEEWTRVRTRFEQERSALQAQLQQMEQELARQKDAFATDATETQYEITQTLDAVKAELQDVAAQALSLKESLTATEEQHRLDQANWETQQQELYQERELLRDRWESTRQEINALRKDLATKEAAIDALNLTQANLFEQLATQQTHSQLELSRLASQLRGAEARVNQTEAELEQRVAAAELEAVQAQLTSAEQAQQALVAEREILIAKLSAADTQLNDLRIELEARDKSLEQAKTQCVRLSDELANLETESQARLDTFAAELQTVRNYLSEKEAECEARVLPEDHEAVKQQLQLQTSAVEELALERETLREQLAEFTARVEAIQEQLAAKEAEVEVGSQHFALAEQHRATAEAIRTERDALQDQLLQKEQALDEANRLLEMETEERTEVEGHLHIERDSLREQVANLSQSIANLQNALASKDAELEEAKLALEQAYQDRCKAEELESANSLALREQIEVALTQIAELQQQLVAKEAEVQAGSQHFALAEQHRATADAIRTERDALQEQLLQKEQALEEANRLLEMETEERTEVEGHLHIERDSLREQVANLSQSIANLQNALASKDAELEEAKLALEQAYQDRCKAEELESDNSLALREQIDVALTQIAELQQQLVAKEAEVEVGNQHFASAEQYRSTAEELRAERDALTEQLTSISAQVAEFQNQLDQKAADIQDLNQQNLEVQEQIQLLATVRLERDAVGEELAAMTAMVAELREHLLQKETAIEEANRLLEMETEERSEVEGRLHAERDGLHQQVVNLSQSIAELQDALTTKDAELLEVKHSFDLSHQDRSKAEERDGTEIQALREQMESSLTQIAELQQQLARKEAELDEASRRWAMAQEQLSHTQSLIQSEAERAQAELREFKANLIAQDEQLAQAIPPETHAIIAQQLSQREEEIALLSQDQEKLCEQLLIAEQRVQELTDKLATQDAKLEQAERSDRAEDQAIDTERLALQDEVARLKDALHLVEDQLATQAEQPEQLSLLTTEVETLRQLLADCQLEVQQLVTERCELHSTIETLKDEQATVRETPEAMSAPIEQPAETPDRPSARAFEGSGFGRDEGRMAASAEDIRMSFAPFDWQAERERLMRANSEEAAQESHGSAASAEEITSPEATESPAAQAVDMPVAQEEVAQDVDSVLNRLMRAGVWKGNDALASSDSTSAPSDSERKSEPSLSAPFTPREGFVTERFSPESFQANEETTEEVIEEPSANFSTSKFLSRNPSAEETEDNDSSSATPAPNSPHGRRAEDRTESVQPAASEPDNGTGDTDESIDSYMERLLSRVRGESATECRLSSKPQKTTTSSRASQAPPDEAQAIRTTASTVDFVDHSEYIPRSQAPEQVSQLSALRELANTAARSALEQHAQKSRRTVSRDGNTAAIGLAVTGVLAGGVALFTGYWQAWAASGIALVASLLLGSKLLGDALRQLKLVSAKSAQEAEAEANSKSEGEEPKQE